ncbi:MAG: D-aminoacyl-tRNA deacylase [Candidatus Izemoplasmatales bacterium]|jgi:D-tyrosyl-tRNA(Tyr) deacylase
MRVVIQRVSRAELKVENLVTHTMGIGLVILVGFCTNDTIEHVTYIANKIAKMRVFPDADGKTNLSLNQVSGSMMSVSQFTLYGDMKDGSRPSFTNALGTEEASELYDHFNRLLSRLTGMVIKCGVFGAHMQVEMVNDGPFTLIIER